MIRMTPAQVAALGYHQKIGIPKREPKHRNVKVYVYADGFVSEEKSDKHGKLVEFFDSKKEYRRACELRLLERAGVISELRRQVPFTVVPAFLDKDGHRVRAVIYKADFTYVQDGVQVVEDVKAFDKKTQRYLCTREFALKWKTLKRLNPTYDFRLY